MVYHNRTLVLCRHATLMSQRCKAVKLITSSLAHLLQFLCCTEVLECRKWLLFIFSCLLQLFLSWIELNRTVQNADLLDYYFRDSILWLLFCQNFQGDAKELVWAENGTALPIHWPSRAVTRFHISITRSRWWVLMHNCVLRACIVIKVIVWINIPEWATLRVRLFRLYWLYIYWVQIFYYYFSAL